MREAKAASKQAKASGGAAVRATGGKYIARELSRADFDAIYRQQIALAKDGDKDATNQVLGMHHAYLAATPPPDPEAERRERSRLWMRGLRLLWEMDPATFIDRGLELLRQVGEMEPAEAAKRLGIELEEA